MTATAITNTWLLSTRCLGLRPLRHDWGNGGAKSIVGIGVLVMVWKLVLEKFDFHRGVIKPITNHQYHQLDSRLPRVCEALGAVGVAHVAPAPPPPTRPRSLARE